MAINTLILTDFSTQALNAAIYALNLPETPSSFYILNAGSEPATQMANFIKKLQQENKLKKHTLNPVFSSQNLIEATRNTVIEKNIDMIVMGASGKNASPIKALGNNTFNVIRKVKCPVLVVPSIGFQHIENIFFPFDNRFPINKMLFSFLSKIPSLNKIEITLIELNLSGGKPVVQEDLNANLLFKLKQIEPTDGLAEKCWKEINSEKNLIILSAKQLLVLEKFFLGNEIRKNLKQQTPVLILHEKTKN